MSLAIATSGSRGVPMRAIMRVHTCEDIVVGRYVHGSISATKRWPSVIASSEVSCGRGERIRKEATSARCYVALALLIVFTILGSLSTLRPAAMANNVERQGSVAVASFDFDRPPYLKKSMTMHRGTAATITLHQGTSSYSGCADTFIYRWEPDTQHCWAFGLKVGHKQQNAALLRFDLSPIARGAIVTQATLQVYATGWSGSDIKLGAYCVLRDADPNQATWNQAQQGSYWGLAGCNGTFSHRRATPESTATTSGIVRKYDFDITALVQEWVDGSLTNDGVLLRADQCSSAFHFASGQCSTV